MNKIPFFFCAILLISCLNDKSVTKSNEPVTTEVIADDDSQNDLADEYYMIGKNMRKNNLIIGHATEYVLASAEETVKTKIQYQVLIPCMKESRELTFEFQRYIKELRTDLITEAGGAYTESEAYEQGNPNLSGRAKYPTNINATNSIFLTKGEGDVLGKKISSLRNEYMQLVAELWDNGGVKGTIFADPTKKAAALAELNREMVLSSSENHNAAIHDNKTWSVYTFGDKPVMRVDLLLQKFENDALISGSACVNFLAGQMGKLEVTYDKFEVFSQSPKPYIRLGETYEAEIALGAYSSQAKFSVSVNGSRLKIVDGKAIYKAKGSTVGEKTYSAKISVQNPLTGETESFTKEFRYEVGK